MHIPDQRIWAAARCMALLAFFASWQPAQAQGQAPVRSGYALSAETCGGFPKLRITMQPGFCAGLVASKGRWADLSAHHRAGAGHALLRRRRHGRLGPEEGPPAAARSGRARARAHQGAAAGARCAARARRRHRPAHLRGRGGQDFPLRSARRRSGRDGRDHRAGLARLQAEALRRHDASAQPASAQALRVRPHRPSVRQHRRAVGCLRDEQIRDEALRGGRGGFAARRGLDVHAAHGRHLPGAQGGRRQPAA